jgi:hypothetical protein
MFPAVAMSSLSHRGRNHEAVGSGARSGLTGPFAGKLGCLNRHNPCFGGNLHCLGQGAVIKRFIERDDQIDCPRRSRTEGRAVSDPQGIGAPGRAPRTCTQGSPTGKSVCGPVYVRTSHHRNRTARIDCKLANRPSKVA